MRENGVQIQRCLGRFEDSLLADQTSVCVIESKQTGRGSSLPCIFPDILSTTNEFMTDAEESELDLEALRSWLRVTNTLLSQLLHQVEAIRSN